MPKLILKIGDGNPREISLTREMTFGRHPGNDVEIHDEKASRRHFRVRTEGTRVVLDDLNSSNGTRINGNRITTCVLKHGDVIMVGAASLKFVDEAAEPAKPEKSKDKDDRHNEHKIGTIKGKDDKDDEKPKKSKDDDEDIFKGKHIKETVEDVYDKLKKHRGNEEETVLKKDKKKSDDDDDSVFKKKKKSDDDDGESIFKKKKAESDDDDDDDSIFSKKKKKDELKKKQDDDDDSVFSKKKKADEAKKKSDDDEDDSIFNKKKKKDEEKKKSSDDDDDSIFNKKKKVEDEPKKAEKKHDKEDNDEDDDDDDSGGSKRMSGVSGRGTASHRRVRRRAAGSGLAGLAVFAAASIAIAIFVVSSAQNGNGTNVAHNTKTTPKKNTDLPPIVSNPNPHHTPTTTPTPLPVTPTTTRVNTPDKPVDPPPDKPVTPPDQPAPETIDDKVALDDLKAAIDQRDKLIAAGNFPVARGAFKEFLVKYPVGEISVRGRKEQYQTEQLIDNALGADLRDAQKAISERKFRMATQRCTRLLAMAPTGKIGVQAKQLLSKLDTDTEARFNEAKAAADKALEDGKLDAAADVLGKAIDELGGTKWAEPISVEQLKVLMTLKFIKAVDEERQKKGKTVPVPLAGVNRFGQLVKIDGFNIEVRDEKKNILKMSMIHMEPWELDHMLKAVGMDKNFVGIACMFMIMKKDEPAQEALAKAMQDSRQLLDAIRLSGSEVSAFKNLKVYDFSKWQHQADWEALSGSWYTKDDQFVLESPEGGDAQLKAESIGGGFDVAKGRISFAFDLVKPKKGFFIGLEFGSGDKHPVTVSFSEAGAVAQVDLGKQVSETDKGWKSGETTNVDLAFDADKLTVTINGKALKPLEAEGLGKLKGTLTFRVRESACNIDDIILRTLADVEEEK